MVTFEISTEMQLEVFWMSPPELKYGQRGDYALLLFKKYQGVELARCWVSRVLSWLWGELSGCSHGRVLSLGVLSCQWGQLAGVLSCQGVELSGHRKLVWKGRALIGSWVFARISDRIVSNPDLLSKWKKRKKNIFLHLFFHYSFIVEMCGYSSRFGPGSETVHKTVGSRIRKITGFAVRKLRNWDKLLWNTSRATRRCPGIKLGLEIIQSSLNHAHATCSCLRRTKVLFAWFFYSECFWTTTLFYFHFRVKQVTGYDTGRLLHNIYVSLFVIQ